MHTVIRYEDEHIIVAYKPTGLATQTAKVGQADMVSELKNHLKGGYVGVVHRLDQPVEGLLVFAKSKTAAAALSSQLQKGILNKHYYAVVCGKPECGKGELVDYLRRTADNRAEIVDMERVDMTGAKPAGMTGDKHVNVTDAKIAKLQFEVLAQSEQKGISLLDIHITTGRFHQIRAQMAHAGFPLLGDVKYGTDTSGQLSREYGVRNVALCAYELECVHPATGETLHFTVEPKGEIFHCFDWNYKES